jgi:hypothetical protein
MYNTKISQSKEDVIMKYKVFDDRDGEIIFQSDDRTDCVLFINQNYDENSNDFSHILIGEK